MSQTSDVSIAQRLQSFLSGPLQNTLSFGEDGTLSESTESSSTAETCRLVGFGAELDGQTLAHCLAAVSEKTGSILNCTLHRPLAHMPAAVVIQGSGLNDALKPMVVELAEQYHIELTLVDNAPTSEQSGVLVMDMDSTAIEIECIDEIAKLAGVGEQVSAVTARAMRGELDFAQSLIARVATLEGADEAILAKVAENLPLMPGLESLVNHLQRKGWVVAIASGGFTYFTDKLKSALGLTATFANVLEIENGRLTGKVLGDIVDASVKAQTVQNLAAEHGIAAGQTVAIGDGANDLQMLAQAALGVAFHAKPLVRQKAASAINRGSLEQLLYLLK